MPVALLCACAAVSAQSYPSKPVSLIVPFAPGGAVDQAGRLIAEPLSRLLGQPFVVENRPGAAGVIAHGAVARAPKDGYSVLVAYSTTNACSPGLYSKLAWDPVKDFTPIGMMAVSSVMITVPAALPVKTLRDFVSYVKQHPGEINYGSAGVGSQAHIVAEMFAQKTGLKMVHVPYKGSGDLMPGLLSGTIQMAVATPVSIMQQVNAGKLKALAVTSMSRDPAMPDVPTVDEAAVPGFDSEAWVGLFVPAGTPAPVAAKLADALKRATELPDFRQRITAAGFQPRYLAPEPMGAKLRSEIAECTTTARNAGIRLD